MGTATVQTDAEPSANAVRPLIAHMRWLLLVGTGLAAIAGTQLFVGTEHTERFFAWTIQSHLTAAFLGATYYSAIPLLVVCALEPYLGPRAGWHDRLVVSRQLRAPGREPPRIAPLPTWFRIALAVQGTIMLSVGAGLLFVPSATDAIWSWELTPLTGRAVGAFVFSTGVAGALGARENDWTRIRGPIYSYAAAAALEFVALARYPDEVNWESATAWAYVAFLSTVLAAGVYGSLAATRSRRVPGDAIAGASA